MRFHTLRQLAKTRMNNSKQQVQEQQIIQWANKKGQKITNTQIQGCNNH